ESSCVSSACIESRSKSLLQHKMSANGQKSGGLQLDELAEELSELSAKLRAQEEGLQKGIDKKDSEVLSHRNTLNSVGSNPSDREVHDGRFELCHAQPGQALEQVSEDLNTSSSTLGGCSDSEVVLFSPTDSQPYFTTECCPVSEDFCAGCAKLNSDKTACEVCSGGFSKSSDGRCYACMDLPGWQNKAGETCSAATICGDSQKYQGFSPQEACCHCGGGQKEARKFSYYVGPLAVGATKVIGYPVPRTARLYFVDKDCELSKYGLTINPTTGALQLAPGCSKVGCGAAEESIEVKCTIAAVEDVTQANGEPLHAQAPLEVFAGDVSYGSGPVVLGMDRTTSIAPAVNPDTTAGDFSGLSCVPDASDWLTLDSGTGQLSWSSAAPSGAEGGLMDDKGLMGTGAVCSVEKGGAKGQVLVWLPFPWAQMTYSYASDGQAATLYATVGEKSPVLSVISPKHMAQSYPSPTRFSASCTGADFVFDVLTGLATWEGHQIFLLDVANGDLQLSPEESLTRALDRTGDSAVRRSIGLQCTIFGHYEWAPMGHGSVITHRLSMELRDHTCWAQQVRSFSSRIDKGQQSENACRSLCRSEAYCTHWALDGGSCYFYRGLCKGSLADNFACVHKHVTVTERYPGCGERHSCVDIQLPGYHYISGKYCPVGENAAVALGPVYFKEGLTAEESFWLMRNDVALCAQGGLPMAHGLWLVG
ncbi:unnamed protein product, partial [Symbiodinium natans]